MIRRAWLVAATAAVVLAAGRAHAAPLGARALLDSVCANYTRLARFHFEGAVHAVVGADTSSQTYVMDIPFLYAAQRPSKLRTEFRSPTMGTIVVSDGESLYVTAPSLQQYTAQVAPRIVAGAPPANDLERALNPLLALAGARENVVGVRDAGRDTVQQLGGVIDCRRLVVEYAPDSTRPTLTLLPRTLWIDEARGLIARDSLNALIRSPQMGLVHNTQEMRFTIADTGSAGPDSLYRFAPGTSMARVTQLGPQQPQGPPDLTGRDAPPFSLATPAGPRVSLAKLKGQVVVLDFWATWCGPCRRWLPIVAGVNRRLAGRGVRVYAVNQRETPEQVRAYMAQTKLVVPVLLDRDGHVGEAYGAQAIPLTIVIGRDGRIARTLLGVHEEKDLLEALRAAGVRGI